MKTAAKEPYRKGKKVVVSSRPGADNVEMEPLALINWVVQSWERVGVSLPMEKTQRIILEMAASLDDLLHGQQSETSLMPLVEEDATRVQQ